MGSFKKALSLFWVIAVFVLIPAVSFAGQSELYAKNACNPCAKNACNPCGKNACNPCNPCGKRMKNACNPCNPCNPCGDVDEVNFFRKDKFKSIDEVIAYGKKLVNDPKLGESGDSCHKCHKGGKSFRKTFLLPYPHYVKMAQDVVTLDQMINFCMINPMETNPLSYGSREMTAIAAYVQSEYPKQYSKRLKFLKSRKSNPCAKNACNPCGKKMRNACNPCNPCGRR